MPSSACHPQPRLWPLSQSYCRLFQLPFRYTGSIQSKRNPHSDSPNIQKFCSSIMANGFCTCLMSINSQLSYKLCMASKIAALDIGHFHMERDWPNSSTLNGAVVKSFFLIWRYDRHHGKVFISWFERCHRVSLILPLSLQHRYDTFFEVCTNDCNIAFHLLLHSICCFHCSTIS